MTYSKVFAFAIVSLLGWLNVGYLVSDSEASLIFDNIVQVVGIVGVIISRYKQGDVTVLGFKR